MKLRLIIGRAGVGKTHRCLSEMTRNHLEDQDRTLLCIVPEQASFNTERRLLEYSQMEGMLNAQILSFRRLAWRVLEEVGGVALPVLNELGSLLILKQILEREKKNFKIFSRVLDTPGFLKKLLEIIAEFKNYEITPALLEECTQRLSEQEEKNLAFKIEDLENIFRAYEEYTKDRFISTEDFNLKLIDKISRSEFLNDSQIWLDGFYGFTQQEYRVIEELLRKTKCVTVAICLDPATADTPLESTDVFYPAKLTYQTLKAISFNLGCPIEYETMEYHKEHRFCQRAELAFIEQSFIDPFTIYKAQNDHIRIYQAASHRVEIEEAARIILRLCREKSCRFRDIAVLFRDYSVYEELLPAIFEEHEIAYFLDSKRQLRHHPFIDLIQSALDILETGWNHEPVFRCLKTDLMPISRDETDLLENYCLEHGIKGWAWKKTGVWKYKRHHRLNGEDDRYFQKEQIQLQRINKIRQKVALDLMSLEENIKKNKEVRSYAVELYAFFEKISVADKLHKWGLRALSEGKVEESKIHIAIWQQVIDLMDQLVETLGDTQMEIKDFRRLLSAGLEALELGMIPPGLDQVMIGILGRSMIQEVKAVLILGVNEGVFPLKPKQENLLSDEERKQLLGLKVNLPLNIEKSIYSEQYLSYIAFTRAREWLFVSCSVADSEGRALRPSSIFNKLRHQFDHPAGEKPLHTVLAEPDFDNVKDYILHPAPVLGYLAASLRRAGEGEQYSKIWDEVLGWYQDNPEWNKKLALLFEALEEKNTRSQLPKLLINKMYGSKIMGSVTRMEKFNSCPFAYFLDYGLRLNERQEYKLRAPDLGWLFHASIEKVYRLLQEKKSSLEETGDRDLGHLVNGVVEDLVPQLRSELLLSTSRYRYLTGKLKRTVHRSLSVLREHEKNGSFRTIGVEVSFAPGAQIPEIRFQLKNEMELILQGRIDRVDCALIDNEKYLRVIDYKSGAAKINLLDIYYGIRLQLITYLDVLLQNAKILLGSEAKPGGVLYFRMRDPFIISNGPLPENEIEQNITKEMKMQGLLIKDAEVIKQMDTMIDGHSKLIPAAIKKNGELFTNQDGQLLDIEQFARLCQYVRNLLLNIGEQIATGEITILPYKYGNNTPCGFCAFRSICRFDTSVPGNKHRHFTYRTQTQIWEEIERIIKKG